MANTAKPVAPAPIDTTSLPDWRKSFADSAKTTDIKAKTAAPEKLTQTDILGRAFFTRFAELKQANLLNNTDIVNQSADDLVTANLQTTPQKTYFASDLHIIKSSNITDLNKFSSAVALAIDSYSATKSEADIMQEYFANSDAKVLLGLDPIIKAYKKLTVTLLAIPTPQSLSNQQLAIINAASALQFSAESLRASDTDTVRGMAGVTAHVDAVAAMIDGLTNMQDALDANNVSFDYDQDTVAIFLK